jgi:ABC-type nitrate/sulfonate/bicarbonate transport system ATPase subunit
MTGLEFKNLGKQIQVGDQQAWLFKDLNLKTDANDFIVILGPSGCGKSSLLRLIAHLDQPSAGQILPQSPQKMSFVFQEACLLPWRPRKSI